MSRQGGGLQWDARLAPGGISSPRGGRNGLPRWVFVSLALLFLLLVMWYLASRGGEDGGTSTADGGDVAAAVRIAESRAGFSEVVIEVTDGRVDLSGELPTQADRYAAEKVAFSVPGVVAVTNNITTNEAEVPPSVVEPPTQAGADDIVLQNDLIRASVSNPIVFGSNSSELDPVSTATIDRVAALLIDNPAARIEVQGHTDSDGEEQANLDLSTARAEVVRQQLIARGIEAERLESKGYGESVPVASNDTKDGKAANRRIEFIILP